MTQEEALKEIKKAMPYMWAETKEAIQTLIPELKESKDERIRKAICAAICCSTAEFVLEANGVKLIDALAYLEKQTGAQPGDEDRYMEGYMNGMNDALKEQKPAEWSEEDEKKRKFLIKGLEDRMGFGWASDPFSREALISWLENLRPSWKPSEEQIQWLESAVKLSTDKPHIHGIIISLYEQLKRL